MVTWIIKPLGSLVLQLLWYLLHFLINIWLVLVDIAFLLESYFVSSGILKRYRSLNLNNVRCLAIVLESDEAHQISEVVELLQWLDAIGVKRVCLYDREGVLKNSKEPILEKLKITTSLKVNGETDTKLKENMTLEFCSFSDGRESVTKAANVIFLKYMEFDSGNKDDSLFSEPQMVKALKTVGYGDPNPDILLIYGPTRCNLGFPPWRLPYTEMIHMGSLKSMRYGSIVKVIYKLTMVRQRYGK